jgi:hypothetical protein
LAIPTFRTPQVGPCTSFSAHLHLSLLFLLSFSFFFFIEGIGLDHEAHEGTDHEVHEGTEEEEEEVITEEMEDEKESETEETVIVKETVVSVERDREVHEEIEAGHAHVIEGTSIFSFYPLFPFYLLSFSSSILSPSSPPSLSSLTTKSSDRRRR